ncbi:MAG: hypothetical protein J4N26_04430 [Chloroflexi bacterium]|nr:hypothetical protein [Chloroflexota bacterium]
MRHAKQAFSLCALVLALTLPSFLAACSDGRDDDERLPSLIHRLLLAAGADASSGLESFPGVLPPDLPVDLPLYPGSDLIVSSQQPITADGLDAESSALGGIARPVLYFIMLDTNDDRGAVFAYYREAFDEDPWEVQSTASTEGLDTLEFLNVPDIDIGGAVSIVDGGPDERTSILISLQDTGAFVEEQEAYDPGESLAVPIGFPEELPLYPGATVTGSAFFREPGVESYLLIFVTTDDQNGVIEFYKEALEEAGLTVEAGEPSGFEVIITFEDAPLDIRGEVLADRSLEDRTYTEVRIQVQVNPARPPSDDEDGEAE